MMQDRMRARQMALQRGRPVSAPAQFRQKSTEKLQFSICGSGFALARPAPPPPLPSPPKPVMAWTEMLKPVSPAPPTAPKPRPPPRRPMKPAPPKRPAPKPPPKPPPDEMVEEAVEEIRACSPPPPEPRPPPAPPAHGLAAMPAELLATVLGCGHLDAQDLARVGLTARALHAPQPVLEGLSPPEHAARVRLNAALGAAAPSAPLAGESWKLCVYWLERLRKVRPRLPSAAPS